MDQVVSRCLNNEGLKPERTPEMMTALKSRVLADSIFEKGPSRRTKHRRGKGDHHSFLFRRGLRVGMARPHTMTSVTTPIIAVARFNRFRIDTFASHSGVECGGNWDASERGDC